MSKRLITILAAIAAAVVIAFGVIYAIQNSNRNKNLESIDQSIEQVGEDVKSIDKRLEDQGKILTRPDSDGFCGTISWQDDAVAWEQLPISKEEFREMASESSYGYPAVLPNNQRIEAIIGALTVDQLYSDSPTQTVVWFTYKSDDGEQHHSKMLIQGSVKCEEKEDLKGLINAQTKCCGQQITGCSILFGGRLCTTPPCQKMVQIPCEQEKTSTTKQQCKNCDGGSSPGPGRKQGDGAAQQTQSNGGNRKIVTNW